MFSGRVPPPQQRNAFSTALEAARAAGRDLIDLTVSNPTRAGITYPPALFAALSSAAVEQYRPEPFGMRAAREAVAADYARRATPVAWDRIVLTASTSEAYSLLFKLLCEPSGDRVLVPAPSYPLFDHLTALDGVTASSYELAYDGRWWVDFDTIEGAWDDQPRALLAVSPNNPTGSVLSGDEQRGLARWCAEREAALIVDEVFSDYLFDPSAVPPNQRLPEPANREPANPRARTSAPPCLTFRLGGLSKSAALPQVKLGWIAVDGPAPLVEEALGRLELICDTYLSVSTPVQVAAADLIAGGAGPRAQVLERVRSNYRDLRTLAAGFPAAEVLNADGGWSAVLRVPATAGEEELTLALLERDSVVVYPGFFFDFPHEAFLVVSLLPPPAEFREGIRRVLERADA